MMGVGLPSLASVAEQRNGSSAAGRIRTAASNAISAASDPDAIQSDGHPAPYVTNAATTAEDTRMPAPTPAKWMDARLPRPAAERRSRTRVEAQTMTMALAAPPMQRMASIALVSDTRPTPTVVAALTTNAMSNHVRGADEMIE